jgi:hypothetical protein
MKISFSPVRSDTSLQATVTGDALIINGETYDFGPLEDGDLLPQEAVQSEWILGPVTREEGEITLTLRLPHGPSSPHRTLFPQPVHMTADGMIPLPPYSQETPDAED